MAPLTSLSIAERQTRDRALVLAVEWADDLGGRADTVVVEAAERFYKFLSGGEK